MNPLRFSLAARELRCRPDHASSLASLRFRLAGVFSSFGILWLLFLALAVTPLASAGPSVAVECGRTTKKGDVTLKLFICADRQCRHGIPCSVTVKDIPANTSPRNKATRIANAIRGARCANGLTVVANNPNDGTVTITHPNGHGVVCDKVIDSTGETMRVTSDGEETDVTYVSHAKLRGVPTEGTATLGFNGVVHTVSTTDKTLPQIYAEWQAAFGQGFVTEDGLTLPFQFELPRSFYFEVTDPGLEIEVTQNDPGRVTLTDDFAAEGLNVSPLGGGVYEVRPQVGIAAGPDALVRPLPLDFLVLVNGVVRHDGRGANTLVRSTCDDEDNCAGGCWVAVNGERRIGRCEGAGGNCGCNVSTALSALLLSLSPGDVVQFVLDPDHRVAELNEANNDISVTVPSTPPAHDFAALGLELVQEDVGLYRVTPRIGIRTGPGTSFPLPLSFVVYVNGELRQEWRSTLDAVHSCPSDNCAGGCFGSMGGRSFVGYCDSGCGCVPTNGFDSFIMVLAPDDVIQLVLDPEQIVDEIDESNNSVTSIVAPETPRLSIRRAGLGARVSWSATSNYVLQTAAEMAPPVIWANETRPPMLVGNRYEIAYPPATAARFFRLAPRHLAAPVPLTVSGAVETLRHALEVLLDRETQAPLRMMYGSQTHAVVEALMARDIPGAAATLEGLTGFVEANATSPLIRSVFRGLVSHVASSFAAGTLIGFVSIDTDGDRKTNLADDDIDGDGLKNGDTFEDDIDGDGKPNTKDDDMDGDGGANGSDLDMDNDGKPNGDDDDIDADGKSNQGPAKKTRVGVGDDADEDIDGDGIPDDIDFDIDGDGLLNGVDPDIDGDGLPNGDPNEDDEDGDGTLDTNDTEPRGKTKPAPPGGQAPDRDGDGVLDGMDDDIDGDGKLNKADDDIDGDGQPNGEDDDIDGDGKANSADDDIDGDNLFNGPDLDVDGDGITNAEDRDIDGDGLPNDRDPDMDGDGIPNEEDDDMDGDDLKNGETDPDIDGDGVPNDTDGDVDGDGKPNVTDDDVDADGLTNDNDSDDDGDGTIDQFDPTPQGQ